MPVTVSVFFKWVVKQRNSKSSKVQQAALMPFKSFPLNFMSSRKRKPVYHLVDIHSLPEISSLDPDSLKEFTKEELLSYLIHFGTLISCCL
jgi:hypothetical protein